MSEATLCVLQTDSLAIYSTSGEVVSVPLPRTITSIWPLPFGLLLQLEPEEKHSPHSYSSPFLSGRDLFRSTKDSPQNNCSPLNAFDSMVRGVAGSMSSHLILKDPLEEPQAIYIEERGKLNTMKEFDERMIWTSEHIPLMASYNEGKMQHTFWAAEVINSKLEAENSTLSEIPAGVLSKHFSFRRIWQGKGSQTASSKVFLASDDGGALIICILLQEQKMLLSLPLQCIEINNEVIYDIQPNMSWTIPAIAAETVFVTRPRVESAGLQPFGDIIVLTSENTLLLYCGKQCLSRYALPPFGGKDQCLFNSKLSISASKVHDLEIVGLSDAVKDRINVMVNNGQIYRCTLRGPSSSLVNDCITAMTEQMNSGLFSRFLALLWGDRDSAYLSGSECSTDSEWDSFSKIIMNICRESRPSSQSVSNSVSDSSWEFLVNSRYHKQYCKSNSTAGVLPRISADLEGSNSSGSLIDGSEKLETSFYHELLTEILDSLHSVYESLKLDSLRKRDLALLVVLLCDIADSLGEKNYLDHYFRDFPCLSKSFQLSRIPLPPKTTPNLFRWLKDCLRYGCNSASKEDLPHLIRRNGSSVVNWARKIISFYSLLCGAEQFDMTLSSGVVCNIASGSSRSREELMVLAMVGEKFSLQQLDLLPAGVSLPLRHALDWCRESPPPNWPANAYVLLGREDLALSCSINPDNSMELEPPTNKSLISMSTPYMMHLHPVSIPSSISDTIELEHNKPEDADSVEGSVTDGMEHIFSSSTQLRFGRDLRLNEVRCLLCSARPVAIQTPINSTASDQDLQQAQLWQLAQRTTSHAFGRGAFTLATTSTLLTEALFVPKLVLAGRLPAQQNATVNLDPNVRNTQELKLWPEFHNAVAAGLRLAPLQGKMSRTWIIYNKPEEPSIIHAGLLLALGLHGHLRVLTITDIYQYYSQEHEITTVGLMLGLAASYRGTMQPAISKSLYVHIPARHHSSFQELELPTLLQSAALMSVGLLYEGSAHPQTMQILLGEIGRRSAGDNVLEREGYAVSAGFSLGLVGLGCGKDLLGSTDTLVDRLFQYIGGKELQNERFHVSTPLADEHNRVTGQVMDGTQVNIDVTAPGAIIALALMYLKTESKLILSRLLIPQTHFDLQFVRPDFIMLLVIARNLIMWNKVHPSEEWIQCQIPQVVHNDIEALIDEMIDIDEMNAEASVRAYINIVVGACISLALRFAGTRDGNSQELLYKYAIYFLNEIKPVCASPGQTLPKRLCSYVDRGTLEACLHLIVLSLCVVMAGSGHLQTFRLLKFLRGRSSADGHVNYGIQMAVSLAIGFLFLGGGMRSFSTSNSSIASLLITLYPKLPTGPNDNRCHLQAFRHLYVLATEARWIQTVDVDTGLPVYVPLEVTVKETNHYAETNFYEITPCILPERAILKNVRVCGPRYWPLVIDLLPEDKPWWRSGDKTDPFNSGVLYIKRKVGACSYVDDPIGCQSLLSRAMHKVFGLTRLRSYNGNSASIDAFEIDQLVSTFSSDPSLIAFAQLCCDPSWNISYCRFDIDFHEFCLQILFECVSKDRPALLQVYLSLYATIGSMIDQAMGGASIPADSLSLCSLKLALAYDEALLSGRFSSSRGGILQSTFLGSLRKRVEEILNSFEDLRDVFHHYIKSGRWPGEGSGGKKASLFLSWYLQWYGVPPLVEVSRAMEKLKGMNMSSLVPLLHLLFPRTHIAAVDDISKILSSSAGN